MKKELSIGELFANSLSFIAHNLGLLLVLAFLSFAGSYGALWAGMSQNFFGLMLYGAFIYCFYYLFMGLYFQRKPIFTADRFVNSFIKMIIILALSFVILLICRLGLGFLKQMVAGLAVFEDFYGALRSFYRYLITTGFYSVCMYLGAISLLSFSFFIPGFAWIDAINDHETSIFTAYGKVKGNYVKVLFVFVMMYGVLPLGVSLMGLMLSKTGLSILYALQTVFQLVVYLHLYDIFYLNDEVEE